MAIIIFFITIFCINNNLYSLKKFDINEYRAEENFRRGIFYYNETKYHSAIEFFIKSLQYKPDFHIARVWLGKAYYRAGHLENSLEEWNTAINEGAGDNILREKLNNLYFRLGHPERFNIVQSFVHLKTIDGNRWDSRRFIQPISIRVDNDLNLYVLSAASQSLHIFDANGNLIKKITGGKKSFKMPYSMEFDKEGNIIISDLKSDLIHKIRKDGKPIQMWGGTGIEDGKFLGPEGIAVDKDNNIYIVDSGNARIQKFSPDGKFLLKFGTKGENEGQFLKPSGITIDENNYIYVSDIALKRIQKFDEYGNFIQNYFENKNFSSLRNIHIKGDYFFIADGPSGMFCYDRNTGDWLNILRYNYNKDLFYFNSDVAFSSDYTIYASDMYKNTVEIFIPEKYKYSNLEVDIRNIDISSYPKVSIYLNVIKKDGSPVVSLKKENFVIKELGVKIMPFALYEKLYDKNKITAIYLVEKSEKMKEFEEELKKASEFFINDILKTEDLVKVINFHNVKWTALNYDYSKLRILEAVSENNYSKVKDFSLPIYESITELMNKLSRRALIFFTTGEFDVEKDFQKYDLDICKNYAKVNNVPVYIINFTSSNEKILKDFANSTGGKYYDYFKDIKKLKKIRNDVLKYPMNLYILMYSTVKNKKLSGTWREIEVDVNYNKLEGKDKIGYFVP